MKDRFIELYKEYITRPGADRLLQWLEDSDFFSAPASTRHHLAVPGGLVSHSVHVFDRLTQLVKAEADRGDEHFQNLSIETIALVSLLHDVCKVDVYRPEKKSRKTGRILPNGKAEWEDYTGYEFDDQLPYGHGEKSVYIVSGFMRLTREEAFAIRYHMGAYGTEDIRNIGNAYKMFPLAMLTHFADMQATYMDEREEK